MTKEEFENFIGKIKDAKENGQNVDTIIKEYEHRNVYFYNDGCINKILANESLATDLVNSGLGLIGSDIICNPKIRCIESRYGLLLYFSRFINNTEKQNIINFQVSETFSNSPNYRHVFKLENHEPYSPFDDMIVILIEVTKFHQNAKDYIGDNCRLAQWLRAIDTLNREADFSEFANDPVFNLLQNEVKISNFSVNHFTTEDLSDFEKDVSNYVD